MNGQVKANSEFSGGTLSLLSADKHLKYQKLLPCVYSKQAFAPRHLEKSVSSSSARQCNTALSYGKFPSKRCSTVSVQHHLSGSALRALAPETAVQGSDDLGLTVVQSEYSSASAPILSGAGGGIFFWWQLGAVKYLKQRHDLTKWQMRGASAGALVACIAACNVDPEQAYEAAHRLSEEKKLFERPLGLAGVWGNLVRQWLNEVLPDNAAEMCRGRLKVVVTKVPSFQLVYIDEFATKDELIDACMASAHIPFFLDWKATATYRGDKYIDGSLTDFINSNNSHLIQCNGNALILDYFQDEELKFKRFDFVKLRNPEEIQGMISMGYKYAARLDKAGTLEPYLNGKVKAAPADVLGSPELMKSLDSSDSDQKASVMDLDIYQL